MGVADMVAMPSDVESRSLACLEAQACGRVLIASDIPASRETVRHGSTGFLFEKGDVDALARQMLVVSVDAGLRARIGVQARAHAERSSLEGFLDAYENVLRATLARSRTQDGGRVLPAPRPARLPSDQRGRAT